MFFEVYKNTRRFTRKLQEDGHTRNGRIGPNGNETKGIETKGIYMQG